GRPHAGRGRRLNARRPRAEATVTRRERFVRRLLACCVFALLAAALVAPALTGAQSGRRQQPGPKPTPAPQRPRTVGAPIALPQPTPTPGQPAATPTPAPNASVEVDEDEVVRVNSNLVPVPASVIDKGGKAVVDLKLEDFELLVDGVPRPIGDVSRAETPVRLALLFDNSSSIRPAREFEKKAAVRFFRNVMRPVDRAAIFSISTDPMLVLPLTSDVRALTRIVEHFPPPEGATSMFDAITMAAEYLRPHPGRKVVLVVSDGADTTSLKNFDETLRDLLAADCQLFAVQTGNSDHPNLRDLVAERRLQELAAQTGGAVYAPKSTDDLDHAFAQISADLAQQYILSYYPSDERRDGRFRAFSLRVVTRPDVRVRTRRGYYAPKG
ncbi:MAG TPA: VWA domain-containing protein, partial [Pyrinomonadaceae bacterium]|nr:VWA domain-containing protein [Pyrinomonadaceae bacterium]